MPVFGRLLGAMRGARALWLLVPLAAPGTPALLNEGLDVTLAAVLLVLVTFAVVWALRLSIPWKALSELARKAPFLELSLPPEGLFSAGTKVYFKLPDAAWAEVRLPKAARLQLRAQRRVWLLGPDEKGRRFLQLPGVLWPHRVKAVTDLPDGAERSDAVDRRIAPPEEDVVLIAHRRRIVGRIRFVFAAVVVAFVLLAAVKVLAIADHTSDSLTGLMVLLICAPVSLILGIDAVNGMLKPLPRGKWTEMVAVPHSPPLVGASGLATFVCRVYWPDGWWGDVYLSKVDPALAANIWATQRLWILGEPSRGTATFAGVPGHAVLGRVKFS